MPRTVGDTDKLMHTALYLHRDWRYYGHRKLTGQRPVRRGGSKRAKPPSKPLASNLCPNRATSARNGVCIC
ncbi:hypothetical protein QO002_005700 [Pararhizobium capsulatum DSM 1112]|uniref:Transposase n=1 Tax=Pararhizobium capsulatum DSM 1112 TaxID=1121113 RepID=A0ABU0BZ19_9HYPH|nr:hypothetical protein [Pararhizobium capsulatum DSM 1112]